MELERMLKKLNENTRLKLLKKFLSLWNNAKQPLQDIITDSDMRQLDKQLKRSKFYNQQKPFQIWKYCEEIYDTLQYFVNKLAEAYQREEKGNAMTDILARNGL